MSASFGVSAAVFSKLQLLLPGEAAAPGTPTGKTGTPNPHAAGAPFNVTVNAVDANWNLVNTIADTIGILSSDSNANLPANAALVSGTRTLSVTLNTVGGQTLTANDLTDGSKTANTSSTLTVGGGAPRKLAIQIQPSTTATAGVPFAQQPSIRVEDAGGNLVATDNGRIITVARGAGTAALQGTLTATTANGLATFTNLSYNLAETITLNFTATGLTNATSSNVAISPGPFSKLQLLVPGEIVAPGTVTGKIGTPSAQTVGSSFSVTVNAVDARWNLVNTVSDIVGLSSSDVTATLPPAANLAAGTTNLTVTFNAPGNLTLTATDLVDGIKTSSTSPAIAVSPAQYTPATGGGAISADGAGAPGSFTALTGPTYSENASGNVGTGTILLNAPTGFVFDTSGTLPSVLVTRLAGSGKDTLNINGVASGAAASMTSVTSTQLIFTVTISSSSGVRCKLTWQNVRVRPTAGTPLGSGNLVRSGTASAAGMPNNANLGLLREVPGAASRLVMQTQPSASATAGMAFSQQPVLRLHDQFGNFCTNNSNTSVSAARSSGSGTLQGTTSSAAVAGVVTFTNLSHNVATNITLAFSASGVGGTNSSIIAISPAAANQLVFTTQPGSTTYGLALSAQPVLKARDTFGNDSIVGLGASKLVSLAISTGSGTLLGTTSLDIGTAAGNGTAAFSGLQVNMAGVNKQLSATSAGLTSALSSTFAVNPAIVTGSMTANSKIYDGTTAATIGSRSLSGVLMGDDVSLSGGIATFASKSVGTAKIVTATGLSLSGADAANYQLASTSASAAANITARSLTVSATGISRVYDGTTSATVTLSDNRVSGDSLTANYSSASFADKKVGTAKNVSVSGISISGTDAANYSANTSASTTANITARSLTVSATGVNKVYDGTTSATVTLSDNRVSGDSLAASYSSASFADKHVSTAKSVSVSEISINGSDAANYSANTTASTTANITARSLTVSATGVNKVYDATTSATVTLSDNRLNGDSLTANYSSASFADKHVDNSKSVSVSGISISGTDAANYSANTTASTIANITERSLTVSATGVNKVYDRTTSATVTLSDNRLTGDSLAANYSSASFADKHVGTAKTVSVSGISIGGADAGNYSANTTASATANITAKALSISGITATDKVYDGTTSASLNLGSAALAGIISGDNVSLNTASATGAFADKDVGANKLVNVSALSLSGADAANYTFTPPTATAGITKAGLTITADDKSRAAGQANPTLTASYSGFVGGETLATSGVTGTPALSTTSTNVAGTYPITAAQSTLNAPNYSFSFVNGVLTVTPAAASSLVILTQPSSTAIAGVPFVQQPAIAIRDGYGNLRSSDNTTIVTVARIAGTGALQGSLSATAINGVATFGNLSHNVANTINLSFSSSGVTNVSSANILVSPAAFSQLQLLVPGETAAPGSGAGKTGTPTAQLVGTSFSITVKAVDAFWNLVNTVTDAVHLSSSDTTADLPAVSALAGGTTSLMVSFNTTGNFTLSATDNSTPSIPQAISAFITVSPAQYTAATGGGAISADGATGTFTSLTGPTYSENASGNVGTGTIILKAPNGFIFDTGGAAPNVLITRLAGSGKNTLNINGVASGAAAAMTSISSTQLVFTVTRSSASGVRCKLAWQNVRVRPTVGTPLASGKLSRSGTSSVVGFSTNANLGTLREVAGTANRLVMQTQPSASATAGVVFAQQPVLQVRDQFGNLRSVANGVVDSTVVSAARGLGSGTLQGTLTSTAINGMATFSNLGHNVATNISLAFSASGVGGTNSSIISISPAAANQLVFTTQPGSTTYGLALSAQPVLKARDSFGNDSTVGLGVSKLVSLAISAGSGTLQGTTSLDIGTAAGNGTAAFSGLQVNMAGANKQLSATSAGLTSALSSTFAVNPAVVTGSMTANSKIYDGTTAATIGSRSLSGVLMGDDVSLSGGIATFASKSVGTAKIVTATGLSLSGADAANYQLASTSASAAANITARSLTVSATGNSRVYDGTTSATVTLSDNRVSGDSLTTSYTGAFADKKVGTAKSVTVTITLSGTDAANYSANTTASTTANITARSLTISATAVNKAYDRTTSATVTLSDDRVAGDSLATTHNSASFSDKYVGTAKTVSVSGISISGADAGNYSANTTASSTADITAKALTVSGITATDKVYDGTTSASLNLGSAALAGVINGDNVSLNTVSATGAFADKNVAVNKLVNVSALSLNGADAANYSLSQLTATASITKAGLTVTADDKSRAAGQANPTLTASYSGFVGGETLATSGVSGSPALSTTTNNVAGAYPIAGAQGTLNAANYSFSFVNGVLTVTPAAASSLVVLSQPSSTRNRW